MLDNLVWHALNTEHAHFAVSTPCARKYLTEVAPFAGTPDNGVASLQQLSQLLGPGETVYVIGDIPADVPALTIGENLPCFQMTVAQIPRDSDPHPHLAPIELSAQDGDAVRALTNISSPGFFRSRTQEMGSYFGIIIEGRLIAMAGERMAIPGAREISGVCTHPAHTGKRYAAKLITHVIKQHAKANLQSFLHVAVANTRALALYKSLGFTVRREVAVHSLTRTSRE